MLGATLLLVAWLTLSGRVALAQAGVAVAGVALAGSRLAQAGYASGSLSEAALYLDDYVTFLELLPQAVAARPTAAELFTLQARAYLEPATPEEP